MRNATRVETQTSKVPTRVTLLFIPYTVTRPSCLIVLVYTPTQDKNCEENWKNLTKITVKALRILYFSLALLFTFCNLIKKTVFLSL